MTALIFGSSIVGLVLCLWMLLEARTRRWLWVAIPLALASPVAVAAYGNTLLGYAVQEQPTAFRLIYAQADDATRIVTALVVLEGEKQPRLYAIQGGDYEANKKAFAQAQSRVAKGVPMRGVPGQRKSNEPGEYEFYVLPPAGLPEKDAG